jgi:hypothetical protein
MKALDGFQIRAFVFMLMCVILFSLNQDLFAASQQTDEPEDFFDFRFAIYLGKRHFCRHGPFF